MRVIAKRSLQRFWERPGCADAKGPLQVWLAEALHASWRTPQDIAREYPNARIGESNRVFFEVGGNKVCVVVEVQYRAGIVWVKSVACVHPSDTHAGMP